MKVKELLGNLIITPKQKVRICSETESRTYETEPGTFAFEGYEDGAEKTWNKLASLHVLDFDFDSDRIFIHAE